MTDEFETMQNDVSFSGFAEYALRNAKKALESEKTSRKERACATKVVLK